MTVANKQELVKYTLSVMDRESDQDIINNMDNFIAVVEEEFLSAVRVPSNEYLAQMKTNEAGKAILPNNYLEVKNVSMVHQGKVIVLERYSYEKGMPLKFSEGYDAPFGFYRWGNAIQVIPAMEVDAEMIYWGIIYSLNNETNGSNFVLKMSPSVYVNGLMRELCAYTKDMDKASYWDSKFKASLGNLQAVEERDKYSGSTPFVTRVG